MVSPPPPPPSPYLTSPVNLQTQTNRQDCRFMTVKDTSTPHTPYAPPKAPPLSVVKRCSGKAHYVRVGVRAAGLFRSVDAGAGAESILQTCGNVTVKTSRWMEKPAFFVFFIFIFYRAAADVEAKLVWSHQIRCTLSANGNEEPNGCPSD